MPGPSTSPQNKKVDSSKEGNQELRKIIKKYASKSPKPNINGYIKENHPKFYNATDNIATCKGVDLSRLTLPYVNFERGHFKSACFFSADLNHAILRFGFFQKASFYEANIANADIAHAKLDGADVTGIIGLTSQQLTQADFIMLELKPENEHSASIEACIYDSVRAKYYHYMTELKQVNDRLDAIQSKAHVMHQDKQVYEEFMRLEEQICMITSKVEDIRDRFGIMAPEALDEATTLPCRIL